MNNACGKFVLVVAPPVVDTGMNTSNLSPCFLPVLGTLFLFSHADVELLPAVSLPWHSSRVVSPHSREDHHRFEAQVQPNLCTCRWKRFDLLFKEYGDKVAVCTVLGDSDRRWFEISGECSMEGDSKRLIHLGEYKSSMQKTEGDLQPMMLTFTCFFLNVGYLALPSKKFL